MILEGMIMKSRAGIIAVAALTLTIGGCGPKNRSVKDASEQLAKTFEKADASAREEVFQVKSALQSSNYVQAITIMDRVVQSRPIDDAQKQAVDALLIQTRQAVENNPKLNSPQLYKAMSDLLVRVHGEN